MSNDPVTRPSPFGITFMVWVLSRFFYAPILYAVSLLPDPWKQWGIVVWLALGVIFLWQSKKMRRAMQAYLAEQPKTSSGKLLLPPFWPILGVRLIVLVFLLVIIAVSWTEATPAGRAPLALAIPALVLLVLDAAWDILRRTIGR